MADVTHYVLHKNWNQGRTAGSRVVNVSEPVSSEESHLLYVPAVVQKAWDHWEKIYDELIPHDRVELNIVTTSCNIICELYVVPDPNGKMYSVRLNTLGMKKIQTIKEFRLITGVGLVEAKHFVDQLQERPTYVLMRVDYHRAADALRRFQEIGCTGVVEPDSTSPPPLSTFPVSSPLWQVVLTRVPTGVNKISLIKELRGQLGVELKTAMAIVSGPLPYDLGSVSDMKKAEYFKHLFEAHGAGIEIRKI